MPTTWPRCLDPLIEGAVNFRDLGGYPAGAGRVRPGLLYRSGMTHGIPPHGLHLLRERFGVRTVIDLRSPQEAHQEGIAPFHAFGIVRHGVPVLSSTALPADELKRQLAARWAGTFDWAATYRRMLHEGQATFRYVCEVLTEPGALPAVIHCTAGRDRTGVVAALILAVLGVDDTEIARDYALSGIHLMPHLPRFARLAEQAGIDAERLARALETSEEAMAACLAYLRARYGSAEAYLRDAGVSAERIDRLRALLLEAPAPTAG